MKKLFSFLIVVCLIGTLTAITASAKDTNLLLNVVGEFTNNTNPPGGSAKVPVAVLTNGDYNFADGGSGPYGQLFGEVLQNQDGNGLSDCDLVFDLGAKKIFYKYKIWSHAEWVAIDGNTPNNRSYALKDWTVSVSDDKKTWKEIDTQIDNNEIVFEKKLNGEASGQYIKFHLTKCSKKLEGFVGDFWPALRLGEIQLYSNTVASSNVSTSTSSVAASTTTTSETISNTDSSSDLSSRSSSSVATMNNSSKNSSTGSTENNGSVGTIIGIVVALIIIGGGITVYVLYRKKNGII